MPVWSTPSSSSRSERIIPRETSPRSFASREGRVGAGQQRARKRDGDGRARAEVPRAAHDLARRALAHVDLAELEAVGVRVLACLEHLADEEALEVAVLAGYPAPD